MAKGKQGPEDINEIAFRIVSEATEENEDKEPTTPNKNPAAVELGRLGGKKGGKARAERLTSEERTNIARKAAQSRWAKKQTEE